MCARDDVVIASDTSRGLAHIRICSSFHQVHDSVTTDEELPPGITDGGFGSSVSVSSSFSVDGGTPAESHPTTDLFHPYWFRWHGGSHDDAIEVSRHVPNINERMYEGMHEGMNEGRNEGMC